jgi:hypothetical protein
MNTEADPWEMENLPDRPDMKATLERLRAQLRNERQRMGE